MRDVTDWKKFAAYLLPSDSASHTDIETIKLNCQNDVSNCKIELHRIFIQRGEVTWKRVVEALEQSGYINVAKNIKLLYQL